MTKSKYQTNFKPSDSEGKAQISNALRIPIAVCIVITLTIAAYSIQHTAYKLMVYADEYDNLAKEIDELREKLEMSQKATVPLEATLSDLENRIKSIRAQIGVLSQELVQKEQDVAEGEKAFTLKKRVLEQRVRSMYKNTYHNTCVACQILFSSDLGSSIRLFGYHRSLVNEDKEMIASIVMYIKDLEEKKKQLMSESARLASIKGEVDKQADFYRNEIKGARDYQQSLSKEIAKLTARQQAILSARLGDLNLPTSLGAGPLYCTDDRHTDPGFSPAFAFFTYGIPHRVGMNQYGALGRAQAGQNYQDILRAYFNNISFEGGREGMRIKVQGYGEMGLEDYLLGIYEMPESWPLEALKAQVVAARSYALAYTNNGQGEICTTQACQVYKGGNKGGQWDQAVRETAGQVMVNNGEIIKAWYSSTDGGYTFTSGDVWGSHKNWTKRTQDASGNISSFSDLHNKAYDKDSPCFYAAQGWRKEYSNSAWLKASEVADIVNVLMLAKMDSSTADHLYQTDKPHPYGGEVWNETKVKDEVRNRSGSPYNNVSSISVDADFNEGKTTTVTISGDAGTQSFSGDEFKSYFNLRAPANIQIVGPLFNIEKK